MIERLRGSLSVVAAAKALAASATALLTIAYLGSPYVDMGWQRQVAGCATAVVIGGVWAIGLAAHGDPRRLGRLSAALKLGLTSRSRGWSRVVCRVVTEEAVWRGTVSAFCGAAFGPVVAATVSSLGFGVMHVHQGGRGVVVNTTNGAVFWLCGYALGGVVAAFAAHLAHNVIVMALLVGMRTQKIATSRSGDNG